MRNKVIDSVNIIVSFIVRMGKEADGAFNQSELITIGVQKIFQVADDRTNIFVSQFKFAVLSYLNPFVNLTRISFLNH